MIILVMNINIIVNNALLAHGDLALAVALAAHARGAVLRCC